MCGLVGVMGNVIAEPIKKAFHDMLYLDVLRGEDSTGVAAISNINSDKTEIEMFKSLGSASDLFYEHGITTKTRTLTYKPVNIFIGHNRYATQGKVIAENAHPFEFDNVVGAHNGTVDMRSLKSFEGYDKFDVDSQIIYSHLSHTQSIDEVWKDADGALALVWYDKVSKKLNMIRNGQRPLFVVYTADDRNVMWASESWMLIVAGLRHNIKLHEVIELKPNRLYTFDIINDVAIPQKGCVFHIERDLPPFVAKPSPVYYSQNYSKAYGRNSIYNDEYWDDFRVVPKVEKVESTNLFLITEFHDVPNYPTAVGCTQQGATIKINIPVGKYKEAKDKIVGRKDAGYYFASKIHRSALDPNQFWCNWSDCQWAKAKPDVKVKRTGTGGFTLEKVETKTEFAPWYDKAVFLTRAKFDQIIEVGCACCDKSAKWEDRNDLLWFNKDIYFCKDCKHLPIVQDIIQQEKSA